MKRITKYITISLILFLLCEKNVLATTIRETLVSGDGYDTILPNTFVVGITKFEGDTILTATRAAISGSNDALFYYDQNKTINNYQVPPIYYYLGADIGWFKIDEDNNAEAVTDAETLSKLSSIDIYYVNNIKKIIELDYNITGINQNTLPNGVEIKNNKLLVDATLSSFEIEDANGKKTKFIRDEDTSNYIEDTSDCYTFENGIILDYSDTCSKNVVIPKRINNELVTGIADNAFKGKNLISVTFPSSITSIGTNAFVDNNNLDNVTFNGKYDQTDFNNNIEEAFDSDTEINYDNDLTRSLKALEDEYTIKLYKDFDETSADISTVIYNEVFKEINKGNYTYHIEKSELTKYYMIHYYYDTGLNTGECQDHKDNSFDIFFTVGEGGKYYIYFQKRRENCTKVATVNKELTINFEYTGEKSENNKIDNIIRELKNNNQTTESGKLVTRRSILEDLIDENNLDYIFNATTAEIVEPTTDEEIGGSITTGTLYLFKDDILYNVVNNFVLENLSNAYYPNISKDNYENIEEYTDAVLRAFEQKTGVTDYSFVFRQEKNRYIERTKGATKTYYIGLFDNQTLEYWSIFHREKIKDTYDSNGFTLSSCFTTENEIITGYDGSCGANVKIPNKINNQAITEISDNAFYGLGILSVQLPNHLSRINNYSFAENEIKNITIPNELTVIGWGAFYNNQIESLNIPNSVSLIEGDAFRKNKIEVLSLPNNLQSIGQGAFSNNKLDDNNAFIYARFYDENTNTYKEDNTKITSYAGRNRDNIIIPNNVKSIGTNSFQDQTITKITLPNTLEEIEPYAFADNKISEIEIPGSVKSISSLAFYNNSNLNNVTLHEGTEEIWEYAFYGSTIERITLPSTIRIIKEYALGNKIKNIKVLEKNNIEQFEEIDSLYENKLEFTP